MRLAVLKEHAAGEARVAIVPETVKRLISKGIHVSIQAGAGERAFISDTHYRAAGAAIETNIDLLLAMPDLVVQVGPPDINQVAKLRRGATLICALEPLHNAELIAALCAKCITTVSALLIPRTTLAQSMDVLSSQSTASGYHAVLLAATALPKFFPMLMTAAGTIAPARVLVLGAGVAGLQAIATARRLGAMVEAYDVRHAVKEQVESLGARFIDIAGLGDAQGQGGYAREISTEEKQAQSRTLQGHIAQAHVCITTALVPGRRAPTMITEEMLCAMRPGAVVVDLAGEQGGNCELGRPGETVVAHNVTIITPCGLASRVTIDASHMYSRNMEKLILHITQSGTLSFEFSNEIVRSTVLTHAGNVVHASICGAIAHRGAA